MASGCSHHMSRRAVSPKRRNSMEVLARVIFRSKLRRAGAAHTIAASAEVSSCMGFVVPKRYAASRIDRFVLVGGSGMGRTKRSTRCIRKVRGPSDLLLESGEWHPLAREERPSGRVARVMKCHSHAARHTSVVRHRTAPVNCRFTNHCNTLPLADLYAFGYNQLRRPLNR